MKSLVVEDAPIVNRIMREIISKHGSCESVINGKEAVDMFLQAHESGTPFDLILMDIMMPEMDGLQAVQIIREKEANMNIPLTQKVKIIMTTALSDPRTVIKGLYESDADSYLVKPISTRTLVDELRKLRLTT
jgi:two-component system chemotaxis response regulator CheY